MRKKIGKITPKYQYIGVLKKSVRYKTNNLWGMNSPEGTQILPLNYMEVFTLPSDFGLIAAREKGSWRLFDIKGNLINDEEYDEIYPFYGLFSISKVRIGNNWGLLNKYGQKVTGIKYRLIKKFGKGLLLQPNKINEEVEFMDKITISNLNKISDITDIIPKEIIKKSQHKIKLKKNKQIK